MGADFNSQVSLWDITHPQPSLKREGVIFPPCEGGLKVGADFNSQVSLRDITHPKPFPQLREGSKKISSLLRED